MYYDISLLQEKKKSINIAFDENIIGAPKCDIIMMLSTIGLFFIAPCKVIALYHLCFFFGIISLLHLSCHSYCSSNYRNFLALKDDSDKLAFT